MIDLLALVGVAVLVSMYVGRAARLATLPSLIGYMLAGVIMGGSVLGILHEEQADRLSFVTDIALGFVAFTIGSELSIRSMRRLGRGIAVIILGESLVAFVMVTFLIYLFSRDLPMALLFGAMAPASAPAGTVAVIQEYRARGNLTKALYAVVGFDDGLAILIYGFAASMASSILHAEVDPATSSSLLESMVRPAGELASSIVLGLAMGLVFTWLQRTLKHGSEVPALTFGFVAIGAGLAHQLHLSLILTNMMIGFTFANRSSSTVVGTVNRQLRPVMPLLFMLFFFLAGAHLQLSRMASLGVVGLLYVLGRTSGLMLGAWSGAVLSGAGPKLRKYLGMGILSQAGVAIGLSLIAKQELASIGSDHALAIGAGVITTITATSIIFEIAGPLMAKIALTKAGEIRPDA